MAFEDKTITCVQCGEDFVFTAGEQAFYAERGLESEPKRCKSCRRKKRKRARYGDRENDGIYRSPAFEGSAPRHQKIRRHHKGPRGEGRGDDNGGRDAPRGRGRGHGRFQRDGGRANGDYRSPAFKEYEKIRPEEEYRSPGFQEYQNIDPTEEYRSPGFQEYRDIDVNQEYRAPAYRGRHKKYKDERPLFHIVCPACGQEAMVPVLPEEREEVLCRDCYREKRRREYEERKVAGSAEVSGPAAAEEGEEPSSHDEANEKGEGGLEERDPAPAESSNEDPSADL